MATEIGQRRRTMSAQELQALETVDVKAEMEKQLKAVESRDPHEVEFLQAVKEVILSLQPFFEKYPKYLRVIPVVCHPERVIMFRVPWTDDHGQLQVNRGFRVQMNQAIGPYKGGLRFHPTVNLSILKFLAFEQTFKNALTTLPLGAGKGGSDFDPKGKSDAEVLRFCQSFMTELANHIGPDIDVPAGDIGVGGREIGFLYGQWRRLTRRPTGVLTGKGVGWGGSFIRPEATGYGLVYLMKYAMADLGESYEGKKVLISGSGNVAQYAAERCMQLGATVLTFSDSKGTIHEPDGFTMEKYKHLMALKEARKTCAEYLDTYPDAKYYEGQRPWHVPADIAFPSATQNEIEKQDALNLVKGKVRFVGEGANMPSTTEAIDVFRENKIVYLPGKAANAGGVAVSGLEMSQNATMIHSSREKVDKQLDEIMHNVYDAMRNIARDCGDEDDFQLGANAAGFKKVADAMFAQGDVLEDDYPMEGPMSAFMRTMQFEATPFFNPAPETPSQSMQKL